ncbi:MAG: OmpA family protein [Candidatus Sedimenticola endophacoides]
MKGALDRVVAFVRASGESRYRIHIGGHTDNVARHVTNNRLAARRIASVADYLVKNGISSSMLSKKNHGEPRPVASNRSERGRGRALNRRVEVRLVKSK